MDLMFEISISKMILFEKIGDESIFYGFLFSIFVPRSY